MDSNEVGDLTPRPDPTRLTSEAVAAATAQWRRDLGDVRSIVETRLDAMDKATELRWQALIEIPSRAEANVRHAQELLATRIGGLEASWLIRFEAIERHAVAREAVVDARFVERDQRVALAAEEARVGLKAALDAAKEAVTEQNKANDRAITKSDAATQKQIDALAALMATSNRSLEEKIADAARRLDRGEGSLGGQDAKRTEGRDIVMGLFVVVSLLLGAGSLITAIVHR